MKFKTNQERMQHPQASLIPQLIWDEYFYGGEGIPSVLTTLQIELMQSKEKLFANLEEIKKLPEVEKLQTLLCCSYMVPPLSDLELSNLIKIIKLSPERQLVFIAITGRMEVVDLQMFIPTLLYDMFRYHDFLAFRWAAKHGNIKVMNRLIDIAPMLVKVMIEASDFQAFRLAAEHGHLDIVNLLIDLGSRLEPPITIMDMLKPYYFEAFAKAAGNGHLAMIKRIIEIMPPSSLSTIIKASEFSAFYRSIAYGHLDVINLLIELALTLNQPNIIHDMMKEIGFRALERAAQSGHFNVINRFLELGPTLQPPILKQDIIEKSGIFLWAALNGRLDMMNLALEIMTKLEPSISVADKIKENDFSAFRAAADHGHLDVINRLIEVGSKLEPPIVADMIKASNTIRTKNFDAFQNAADHGHLDVINRLIEIASKLEPPIVADMIKANNFYAFTGAAASGHLDVMKRLIDIAARLSPPVTIDDMIKANNFAAFLSAARNGQIDVISRLLELSSIPVTDMIAADDFKVFKVLARDGNLNMINRLIELILNTKPLILKDMIKANNFEGFLRAVRGGHHEVVNKLLTFPLVFDHAETHGREYGYFVKPFIDKKLETLKHRRERNHPTVVVTQQEAQICFYILRNLIRQPLTPEILANIEFLISIPAVKSLLHRPISAPDFHNELLRQAMRLGNRTVADLLMNIPEVMAQAERDGFYPNEASGNIDLRTIAQNRESSILALSPQEQTMLSRVEKKYRPRITEIGVENAFANVFKAIIARYNNNPAVLTLENGETVKLPLDYQDFARTANKLSTTENKNALKAYYQHPTHTTFRYLSKPNPWMARNLSYVETNRATGEQWSTFEGYKDMITLLWLAAADESEPATDGFTVETRLDELIYAIALIGRAHNWDKTRVKTDTNGQAILDNKGNLIREQYDDLEGDKPSCYSGVKRRLFYSLKGSPLFKDIQTIISFTLLEKLRAHMMEQFKKTDTPTLEAVLIDYGKLIQGEHIEVLPFLTGEWNVPEATIMQWKHELQKRYSEIFGPNEVREWIEKEFENFFKQSSNVGNQFLALAERCQLIVLCEQELNKRSDTLANSIKNEPNLIRFLNQNDEITGETRLLNAIHLGLLEEIGKTLGPEKFTQLLSPDKTTRKFYAGILAAYADNPNIDNWLAGLNQPDKTFLKAAIKKNHKASKELKLLPIQVFETLIRNLNSDNKNKGINALYRNLIRSKTTKIPLEDILSEWLSNNPENELRSTILDKALELNLTLDLRITTSTSATTQSTSLSSLSESEPKDLSEGTFEKLPNDPAGLLLKQVEDEEQRVEVETRSNLGRYSFYTSHNEADGSRNIEPPGP